MSRFLFAIAFLLGAAAVLWMGQVFIDNSLLGLSVTVVIGLFFALKGSLASLARWIARRGKEGLGMYED